MKPLGRLWVILEIRVNIYQMIEGIGLHGTERTIFQLEFKNYTIFGENTLAIGFGKSEVYLNMPKYVGQESQPIKTRDCQKYFDISDHPSNSQYEIPEVNKTVLRYNNGFPMTDQVGLLSKPNSTKFEEE